MSDDESSPGSRTFLANSIVHQEREPISLNGTCSDMTFSESTAVGPLQYPVVDWDELAMTIERDGPSGIAKPVSIDLHQSILDTLTYAHLEIKLKALKVLCLMVASGTPDTRMLVSGAEVPRLLVELLDHPDTQLHKEAMFKICELTNPSPKWKELIVSSFESTTNVNYLKNFALVFGKTYISWEYCLIEQIAQIVGRLLDSKNACEPDFLSGLCLIIPIIVKSARGHAALVESHAIQSLIKILKMGDVERVGIVLDTLSALVGSFSRGRVVASSRMVSDLTSIEQRQFNVIVTHPVFKKIVAGIGSTDPKIEIASLNTVKRWLEQSPDDGWEATPLSIFYKYDLVAFICKNITSGPDTSIGVVLDILDKLLISNPDDESVSCACLEMDKYNAFDALRLKISGLRYYNEILQGMRILDSCFEHHLQVASISRIPYTTNAAITSFKLGLVHKLKQPFTLIELELVAIVNILLLKPRWWEGISSDVVVQEWRDELASKCSVDSIVSFALQEVKVLADNHVHRYNQGMIRPGSVKCTSVYTHGSNGTALNDDVMMSLVGGSMDLEESLKAQEHFIAQTSARHGEIVYLIDPSLFPLVYGTTFIARRRLRQKFAGSTIPWDVFSSDNMVVSSNKLYFRNGSTVSSPTSQWLATDVYVDEAGKVHINSYINNLNPLWHRSLYTAIACVIERFIPVLSNMPEISGHLALYIDSSTIQQYVEDVVGDDTENIGDATPVPLDAQMPSRSPNEIELSALILKALRLPKLPSIKQPIQAVLNGHHLQVIVEMRCITLSNTHGPKFCGENWNSGGLENEKIVASGFYVYSRENITQPTLDVKVSFNSTWELSFLEALGHDGEGQVNLILGTLFDMENMSADHTQGIGKIELGLGEYIVVPRSHQRRLLPFELSDDKIGSGHLKYLIIHFVEPSVRIVSTGCVPPQQESWYTSLLDQESPLPPELWPRVATSVQGCLPLKEALRLRHIVHEERYGKSVDATADDSVIQSD
ncbi:hypothetical protein BASA60_010198 [Batrachochytrium salamandrivorans]|nr:hypothetical protein BASA60_010198 [Batrachochytrium salamandrivorans]